LLIYDIFPKYTDTSVEDIVRHCCWSISQHLPQDFLQSVFARVLHASAQLVYLS